MEGWLLVMSIFIFPCVFCAHSSNKETFYKERADIILFNCNKKYFNAKPVLVYEPFGFAIDTEVFRDTQNTQITQNDNSTNPASETLSPATEPRQEYQELLPVNRSHSSDNHHDDNNGDINSTDAHEVTPADINDTTTAEALVAEVTTSAEATTSDDQAEATTAEPEKPKTFSWWDAIFPG